MSDTRGQPQPSRRAPLQRVPPHDLDAEGQVLGAAMLNMRAAEVVAELDFDCFYGPAHQNIHAAIVELVASDNQPDPGTVAAILRHQGLLDASGGASHLTDLLVGAVNITNAPRLAQLLRDLAARRRTLSVAGAVVDAVYANLDTAGLIAELHAASDAALRERPSTWDAVNLARALAGEGHDIEPAHLARTDGATVLYPGKVHSFIGEPESGKSWLALLAATQAIHNGQHVLYIDFEADDVTQVTRLLELGVRPDDILERFHYLRPDEPISPASTLRITAALHAWPIALAIVDGVAEALAMNSWDENKASDVTNLYVRLCRPLAAAGASVVTIDHVVKDKDAQGRYARGSTAKLAAIDGAVYKLETVKPFGRGLCGTARILVNKDRHGHVRSQTRGGKLLGELHLDSTNTTTYINLELTPPATQSDEPWQPTGYMEKVSRALDGHQDLPANTVATLVGGKKTYVLDALRQLVVDGYVTTTTGPRGSLLHTNTKPYRDPQQHADVDSRRYGNDD